MDKVRYGIVGVGNQGSGYAVKFFDNGKVENGVLVAVCDSNPAKLEALKARMENSDITYFTDYKEMLDSGVCDAVIVATPHYVHPEITIECLKRNIHVLCEKPAGVYTQQVREMNAAAEQSNALFGLVFNQRMNSLYKEMRKIIQEGGIGDLQRVTWIITDWFRTQFYYDAGSWRATWDGEGGGVLINQCPHQLDLLLWIVGKRPVAVNGFCKYGKWHDIEVEDEVTAYLEYDNGATGVFITTTGEAPGSNRLEISGTKGKLLCENGKLTHFINESDSAEYCVEVKNAFKSPTCTTVEVETDGNNPQHAGILNNFTNAILGKEALFVDGKEGVYSVELMNAIEYSGWMNGAKVSLPIDEKKYIEELNKRRCQSRVKQGGDSIVNDTTGSY